jgi:hypothetical protein
MRAPWAQVSVYHGVTALLDGHEHAVENPVVGLGVRAAPASD